MKTKGIKITGILAGAVVLTLAALPHVVDIDRFRPQLESSLSSTLGREVHVGHMEISLLAGGARVNQISVADDPAYSTKTFLQAKSLGVGVSLLSLIFSRSVHVTSLSLDEPQLTAIQSEAGEWNFASLGAESKSEGDPAKGGLASVDRSVVLDRLKISNATIEVVSSPTKGQATTLKNVSVDLKNISVDEEMSFVLSARSDAGDMEIKGEAGPLNRAHPEQTPFHADIKGDKADMAQIAALGASSALAGILTFDGTVTSNGVTIHSEGKARADGLRLVGGAQPARQTVSLRYETDYDVAQKIGMIRSGEIGAGKSIAKLSGSYDAPEKRLIVHLKIAGSQLPLDSVEGVLPVLGIVLPGGSRIHGGTVNANLSIDGPLNRVVTSGNAQIANAHLAGFDLGSKMSSLPAMGTAKGSTDLSISKLGTNLRIGPDGTHIIGFNGEFAGIGSITGDGDVSTTNRLQFKMVAHVGGDGAVRFGLNHVGLKNVPNEIPFQVIGTTSVPVIIPDVSGIAKNSAKAVVTNAARSQVQKFVSNAKNSAPTQQAPTQQANNRKLGGFFHKLFGRKDKQVTPTNGTQMASQKTRY